MKPGSKQTRGTNTFEIPGEFSGFREAALDFLRELKINNDRDWFRERKHIFEAEVRKPMEALVHQSAAVCRRLGFTVYPKDKNPLTRIYRDIRFSADKTPFHTHIGAVMQAPGRKGTGEIYIQISSEGSFAAAGYWMPERQFLNAWRERMAARPEDFGRVLKTLQKKKLEWLEGYSLKRLPRGFEAQAGMELEEYFKKQVYIVRQTFQPKDTGSPRLADAIAAFALSARPLLEYGWSLKAAPARDILETS